MKITHVVPYIYPAMAYGGPAKLVYQLALEQQKQGNNVSILTSDSFNNKRRFSEKEKAKFNKVISTFFSKNIINSVAYNQRLFTNFGIIPTFFSKLNNTDLFHIHDVYVLPQILLMYLLILLNKKYIISPHGILDPVRTKEKVFIKDIFFNLLKPCFKHSQFIIATSDKEREDLNQIFPPYIDKIKTVWNGVEEPKFKIKKTKSDKIRLLYIGKLHQKKGLTKFIKALNDFPDHQNIFKLTIAGPDDGDKENIDKLINNLNIKVNRLNFVDEEQKIELYQNHDIFIHPSDSEGFSISIIEALSFGLPIFVTKACGYSKKDLENSGFFIENNIVKEIKKGLDKIVKDKNKLKEFSTNTQELFKKGYTMKAMVKNLDSVINQHFFGIKIESDFKDGLFKDAYNLYFSHKFNDLYPKLNDKQNIEINFQNSNEFKEITNQVKLSNFVSLNNSSLEVIHNYLTTQTQVIYNFENDLIKKIDISFKSTTAFNLINILLKNLLKKNLFKQITKQYIQHPLLLDIIKNNNLNCLHASAVEKNGEVVALMGMNSVGKSTLLSQYIKKGFKVFSDNYLLFDNKGTTHRYPSSVRLDNKQIAEKDNNGEFGYGKSLVSFEISDKEKPKVKEIHILQRGSSNKTTKIEQEKALQLINNLQIIDKEDIRYSITQLKYNQYLDLKFNKDIKFFLNTIKNNE